MIWSAELLLGLTLAGPVPDGLAARVRESIAREWRVASDAVRLQWGTMPIRARLDDGMAFRLAGRGIDGRYVLLVSTDRGELAVSLRAGVEDSVWVASRALGANASLTPDDVKREVRLSWGPATAGAGDPPIGWETQRALRPGELLTGAAAAPPPLVAAGEVVRFEWVQGPIAIVREAVAGNRARLGEIVWARDRISGERLTGTVVGRARARLARGDAS